jgi:hypothetical protein
MLYLQEEKVCICGLAEVLSQQISNKNGPQIANTQSITFAKGPKAANLTNYLSLQICGSYLRAVGKKYDITFPQIL